MTKHDAMKAYIEPKVIELVGNLLNFNYSEDFTDTFAFITNYSDKVVKKYLRIGADKAYGFTIIITKGFSTNADDLNIEAMNFAQAFMDWLEEKNMRREYPDFGEKCQIKRIENLQDMPNFAGVDMKNMVARYMIQCRVVYFEKIGEMGR